MVDSICVLMCLCLCVYVEIYIYIYGFLRYNATDNVQCYSIFPSNKQKTSVLARRDVRVFELGPDTYVYMSIAPPKTHLISSYQDYV